MLYTLSNNFFSDYSPLTRLKEGSPIVLNVPGFGKEDLEVELFDSGILVSSKPNSKSKLKYFLSIPKGTTAEAIKVSVDKGQMTINITKESAPPKRTLIELS